jgi:glutaredoxin
MQIVVYSRPGCHLCDDALALLAKFNLSAREVNIDDDPKLREQFDTCVPVVEIDGQIRFRGRIDPRLLERLVAGRGA